MSEQSFEGGCLCAAVRYRITGEPMMVEYCHCGMCRRVSGAPVGSWVDVPADSLSWLKAAPKLYQSSPGIFRGFCAACGSTLSFQRGETPPKFSIALGGLDDAAALPPRQHIFTADALPWLHITDDLPRYEEHSPAGGPVARAGE